MKKYFAALIILATIFLSQTLEQAPSESNAIRLGATVPLTGDFATYGLLIKDGIELARQDLEREGYQVEVYYEDVNMPGPGALTAISSLIREKKIHGLAANFLNPVIPVMAPLINRQSVPSFHTAIADDLILDSGEFVLSTNAKIQDEAKRLAEYAYHNLGARTASVLYITTTFGDNYSEHFRRYFEQLGGKVLHNDTTQIGEADLRAPLSVVKEKEADVFFAAYFGTNLGAVLKQARQLGIDSPILSVYETEDPSVLEVAGSAAEGVLFFSPEPRERDESFGERFRAVYGYSPRLLAANAYDATRILVKALSDCELDSACAKKELYRVKNYRGASGLFSIDPDGGATKEFVLKTVKDGEFVVMDYST